MDHAGDGHDSPAGWPLSTNQEDENRVPDPTTDRDHDVSGCSEGGSALINEPGDAPESRAEEEASGTYSPQSQLSAPPLEVWRKDWNLPQGRTAADPRAQTVRFPAQNLEEVEMRLREYLEQPTIPAEHATVEISLSLTTAFLVDNPFPPPADAPRPTMPPLYGDQNKTVISALEAMAPPDQPNGDFKKQRVIARAISRAVMRADGFKYTFQNNWLSKDDQAHRFSYCCNDSFLNKGRASNLGPGTVGKKSMKPVYNCQGHIHIKFSITKQSLIVAYRHIPVHKTYEERAPLPRKGSERRKNMELYNPELLKKLLEARRAEPKKAKKENARKRGRPRGSLTKAKAPVPGENCHNTFNQPVSGQDGNPTEIADDGSSDEDVEMGTARSHDTTADGSALGDNNPRSVSRDSQGTAQSGSDVPQCSLPPPPRPHPPTKRTRHVITMAPYEQMVQFGPPRDLRRELDDAIRIYNSLQAQIGPAYARIKQLEKEKEMTEAMTRPDERPMQPRTR